MGDIVFSLGSRKVNLQKQRGEAGLRLYHEILGVCGVAFSQVDQDNPASIFAAIKAVKFEDLWSIANRLFKNALVDNEKVTDLAELFDDPTEFYVAIYEAVKGNYPDFFQKLVGKIADSAQGIGKVISSH